MFRARFRTVAAATCQPIVRPNYGYFNKALPRSAPQVLIITGIKRCFDTADKFNRERQLTVSRGVPRQPRLDRDSRQGRAPGVAALTAPVRATQFFS